MVRLKQLRGKGTAVTTNVIALALAIERNDPELDGLNQKESNNLFGLSAANRVRDDWVDDERLQVARDYLCATGRLRGPAGRVGCRAARTPRATRPATHAVWCVARGRLRACAHVATAHPVASVAVLLLRDRRCCVARARARQVLLSPWSSALRRPRPPRDARGVAAAATAAVVAASAPPPCVGSSLLGGGCAGGWWAGYGMEAQPSMPA